MTFASRAYAQACCSSGCCVWRRLGKLQKSTSASPSILQLLVLFLYGLDTLSLARARQSGSRLKDTGFQVFSFFPVEGLKSGTRQKGTEGRGQHTLRDGGTPFRAGRTLAVLHECCAPANCANVCTSTTKYTGHAVYEYSWLLDC